MFLLSWIK